MIVSKMRRHDFDSVPESYALGETEEEFYSVVIIPVNKRHQSGYRIMDFVFCDKHQEPICRVSRGSDVLHIDGIGGHGRYINQFPHSNTRPIEAWTIDCLPCGYLRLMCRGTISIGNGISDFEIYFNELCN